MLRKILLTLTGLLLMAAAGAAPDPASAAPRSDAIWPRQLRCYDDLFAPYFMQQGDTVTGLNIDILTVAARRAGIPIVFRSMPWRRLESELMRGPAGSVDCAFALSRTPQRLHDLVFGDVALQPTDYVLFVRNQDTSLKTLDDLRGKTIGVRAGFRLPDAVRDGAATHRWEIAEVGTDAANFQKLALGRVDAVLADRTVGLYTLQQLRLREIHPLTPSLSHFDTYLVFKKSRYAAPLAAAFDQALKAMYLDGTIERLSAPYITPAPATAAPGRASNLP